MHEGKEGYRQRAERRDEEGSLYARNPNMPLQRVSKAKTIPKKGS